MPSQLVFVLFCFVVVIFFLFGVVLTNILSENIEKKRKRQGKLLTLLEGEGWVEIEDRRLEVERSPQLTQLIERERKK